MSVKAVSAFKRLENAVVAPGQRKVPRSTLVAAKMKLCDHQWDVLASGSSFLNHDFIKVELAMSFLSYRCAVQGKGLWSKAA